MFFDTILTHHRHIMNDLYACKFATNCGDTTDASTAQHSTAQHKLLCLNPGKICAFLQSFFCLFKSASFNTDTGLRFALICGVLLLPHAANAVPNCLPITHQLMAGHNPAINTYITPFANPQIGDFIGAVQTIRITVRCKYSPGATAVGIYFRPTPGISSTGLTAKHGYAQHAQVHTTTALEARGIGFTILWQDMFPYISGNQNSFGVSVAGILPDSNGYITHSYGLSYRFIKINNNFAFGSTGTLSNVPFDIVRFSVSDGYMQASGQNTYYIMQSLSPVISGIPVTIPQMTIARRTCTTPYVQDGIVKLPNITTNSLPQVGSTGPQMTFEIRMNCPPHLGYVGYYVVPVHGIVNPSQGVIAINPNSQAKGIGLQLEIQSVTDPYMDLVYDPNNPQLSTFYPMRFGAGNIYKFSGLFNDYYKDASDYGTFGEPLTATKNYSRRNKKSYWKMRFNLLQIFVFCSSCQAD